MCPSSLLAIIIYIYISPLSVSASDRSRSTSGLGTKCYYNLGMTNDDSYLLLPKCCFCCSITVALVECSSSAFAGAIPEPP